MRQVMGNLSISTHKSLLFTFQVKPLGLLFQFSTDKLSGLKTLDDISLNTKVVVFKHSKIEKVTYTNPHMIKLGNFFGLMGEKNESFILTFNSNIIKGNWKIYLSEGKQSYTHFLIRT